MWRAFLFSLSQTSMMANWEARYFVLCEADSLNSKALERGVARSF